MAVGSLDESRVAVGSHRGLGIVDAETGTVLNRTPDPLGDDGWLHESPPRALYDDEDGQPSVQAAGLRGGTLPTRTEDGWTCRIVDAGVSLFGPGGSVITVDDDDEPRACGFSPEGQVFVFATAATLRIGFPWHAHRHDRAHSGRMQPNPPSRESVFVMRGRCRVSDIEIQELYAASYRRLLGQLIGVTGSVAEAEDVVQEAFVRGLDHPTRLLGADNPEAWLRTVAVNLARSRWRRAQRLVGLAPRLVDAPRESDSDGHIVLLQALRALPAGQREAIALHHLADLTVEEVAATLGLPTGTVKARLSRGRAALSARLVKEGPHV